MGHEARNPGFLTKRDSNQSPTLQRLARKWYCLDMILSKKQIIKALISLRGCAGWSAPSLFANPDDRFSCVEAHIITVHQMYAMVIMPQSFAPGA